MNENEFYTHTIISAGTGYLMVEDSRQGFNNIYRILEYMSGEKGLMIYQLPRVSYEVEPYLQEQFPWLMSVKADLETMPAKSNNADALLNWLQNLVQKYNILYGERQTVIPMHQEDHEVIDPITEAEMLIGKDKIITIDLTEDEPDDDDPA